MPVFTSPLQGSTEATSRDVSCVSSSKTCCNNYHKVGYVGFPYSRDLRPHCTEVHSRWSLLSDGRLEDPMSSCDMCCSRSTCRNRLICEMPHAACTRSPCPSSEHDANDREQENARLWTAGRGDSVFWRYGHAATPALSSCCMQGLCPGIPGTCLTM